MADTQVETTRLCRRYCAALRRELAAAPQLRRRALRDMRRSIDEYLAQHPAATMADLEQEFGSPQQAADNILNALDAEQIKREARRFRWRRIIVYIILGLALAYIFFYCGRLAVNRLTGPGYVIIEPAEVVDGPIPTNTPVERGTLLW